MTKQLQVLLALKSLVAAALPGVDVVGLDGADAADERIRPFGCVTIAAGDPGEPEIDLSPITYNYDHQIPIEIETLPIEDITVDGIPAFINPADYPSGSMTALEVADCYLQQLADAIEANRFLGGLVEYLDAASPTTDDMHTGGAAVARNASISAIASYSTNRPL